MVTNSTFLFVLDNTVPGIELTDINFFFDNSGKMDRELDEILNVFNYTPSEETIRKLFSHIV